MGKIYEVPAQSGDFVHSFIGVWSPGHVRFAVEQSFDLATGRLLDERE